MSAHDERFKRQLVPALDLWVSEELVSPDQAARLRGYYELETLDQAAHGRFGSFLLAFGAILVGLGLITFVAANWDAIGREARCVLGISVMLALDVAGYYLWRRTGSHRFGSALLLMGAFGLGGNIALMAQWFQIGGSGWGLFLAWSIGSLALALGLRHGLVGTLACLTMLGVVAGGSEQMLFIYPWVFVAVFVPLATWCDSRTLLYVAIGGAFIAVIALTTDLGSFGLTAAVALASLALWSWAAWHEERLPLQDLPGRGTGVPLRPDQDGLRYALAPRTLAVLALLMLLQFWAFKDAWRHLDNGVSGLAAMPLQNVLSLLVCLVLAVACWVLTLSRQARPLEHWGLGITVAALLGLLAASQTVDMQAPLLALENVLLLVVELGLAWLGLVRADRRWFWLGLLGLTFQVFARFVEYDTDLVAKSIVFTLWGVLLIGVGWWFERAVFRRALAGPTWRPREET